jgi:transposase
MARESKDRKSEKRARKEKARTKRQGQYRRHEVTDEEWEFLRPLIPVRVATTGRPPCDPRLMLNGIMWVLKTGAPWRDLPERFGPHQTVYDYYRNWRNRGVYGRILEALHIRLDHNGQIDWDLWCIDGSNVRAARAAAGADKKVSNATKTSPKTTLWAARAADSPASSTWLLTAEACP